jgi:Spy/CpxP family protein refolding chaperone
MINAQRLSRIITSKEVVKAQSSLLSMYESLTPSQRQEIKELLVKNRDNEKYKKYS